MFQDGNEIRGQGYTGMMGTYGSYGHGGYAGDVVTVAYSIKGGGRCTRAQRQSDKCHVYKINSVDPGGTSTVQRDRDEARERRIAVEKEKQVYTVVSRLCVSFVSSCVCTCK